MEKKGKTPKKRGRKKKVINKPVKKKRGRKSKKVLDKEEIIAKSNDISKINNVENIILHLPITEKDLDTDSITNNVKRKNKIPLAYNANDMYYNINEEETDNINNKKDNILKLKDNHIVETKYNEEVIVNRKISKILIDFVHSKFKKNIILNFY